VNDIPDFLRVENRGKPFPAALQKPLVFSYSFLNAYKNCPYAAAQRYIFKKLPYVETPEMKRGNEVHAALEHRIGANKPLPPELMPFEKYAQPFDGRAPKTELKLGITATGAACDFFASNVFLRGKVDCTIMSPPNAYMADWKTGNSRFEDRFELDIGALMLRAKYPGLTHITGRYVWLKDDRLGQAYDLSDTGKVMARILEYADVIEGDRRENTFEKTPSGLCGWCDCLDCEHNRKAK
jgi:RecB family exonuclease